MGKGCAGRRHQYVNKFCSPTEDREVQKGLGSMKLILAFRIGTPCPSAGNYLVTRGVTVSHQVIC